MKNFVLLVIFTLTFFVTANAQWEECVNWKNGAVWGIMSYNNITFTFGENGIYSSTDTGDSWTSKNNGLTDLKVISLVQFGNNLLSCGYGGIYLSRDSGLTWLNLDYGFSTTVGKIATKNDTIFIGTFGLGVFFSADTGKSWRKINKGLSDLYIYSLMIYRNEILTGTGNNGIFLSNDNGENWKSISSTDGFYQIYTILSIDSILFANSYGSKGILVSFDNGNTWVSYYDKLENNSIYTIFSYKKILFAGEWSSQNGIYFSRDLGLTWTKINGGLNDFFIQTFGYSEKYIFTATSSDHLYRLKVNDLISGINEINGVDNFLIYPNPAESFITLNLPPEFQTSQIKIYSVEGICVYQTSDILKMSDVSAKIDVSSFSPGVYYVKVGDRVLRFVKM